MIITSPNPFGDDRIRLIAIEMKGAFGNEGALPLFSLKQRRSSRGRGAVGQRQGAQGGDENQKVDHKPDPIRDRPLVQTRGQAWASGPGDCTSPEMIGT